MSDRPYRRNSRLALGIVTMAGTFGVLALVMSTGCLAEPPGHLPSSIRILYSKTKSDSLGQSVDVYFLLARSGNELRLTDDEGRDTQPVFSPGLRRVFFTREVDGAQQIWSMDLGGGDETVVLATPGENFRDPAPSPIGSRLAFTRVTSAGSRIEVAGIDGSSPLVVSPDGGAWSQPRWSPDGRTLLAVGPAGGVARLHQLDPEGGMPRPLTTSDPGAQQGDPSWSPDGRRVVFRLGTGVDAEIAIVDVAGGAITRLTKNDVEDTTPSFSPSGERVVFVSRRPHGHRNLWLMDADGSNARALTESDETDAADPDWI